MKLLLDENLSPETSEFLKNLGHDAETVRDAGMSGKDDEEIAVYAEKSGRIILTHNYDFADLTCAFPRTVPAIIRLRIKVQTEAIVHPILKRFFDTHAEDRILGHLVTVSPGKVRFRKLSDIEIDR
ncbi:MAG: DUF5615 family PIN-like protein [Planctomycetes bacterium]|nr:DUF5615 family PIN-like protein [Planctomycetota bacterium]